MLLMVEGYVFVISSLRPSNKVILPRMPVRSAEARELEDVWMPVDACRVSYCRLRKSSLVKSCPFLLSLLPCCCLPCCLPCACPWLLRVLCPCYGSLLSFFDSLGLEPSLVVGPRRDLSLSLSLCLVLSMSVFVLCWVLLFCWVEVLLSLAGLSLWSLPTSASGTSIAQCCSRPSLPVLVSQCLLSGLECCWWLWWWLWVSCLWFPCPMSRSAAARCVLP